MLKVGLTGGTGAGKSTAARVLKDLGAVVIDADQIARDVVSPGSPGLTRIVQEFGDRVLTTDGTLDRPVMASIVFADRAALRRLESITHPLIRERTSELMDRAPADAVIVHDIPLLAETAAAHAYQLVLVVHAAEEARVDRLVTSRGMSEADARSRVSHQASEEQRLAVADVVLDNDGHPDHLTESTARLWHERLVPFERSLRTGVPPQPVQGLPGRPGADPVGRVWARVADALHDFGPRRCGETAEVLHVHLSRDNGDVASLLRHAGYLPTALQDRYRSADPGALVQVQLSRD